MEFIPRIADFVSLFGDEMLGEITSKGGRISERGLQGARYYGSGLEFRVYLDTVLGKIVFQQKQPDNSYLTVWQVP